MDDVNYEWDERTAWVAKAIAAYILQPPPDAFEPGVMPSPRFLPYWFMAIDALREADRYRAMQLAADSEHLWEIISSPGPEGEIELDRPQGAIGVGSSVWWFRHPDRGRGTVKGFFKNQAVIDWHNLPLAIPTEELTLSDPDLEGDPSGKVNCGPVWTSPDGNRRVCVECEDGSEHFTVMIEAATVADHWYPLGWLNSEGSDYGLVGRHMPGPTAPLGRLGSPMLDYKPPDSLEFIPIGQSPRRFGPGSEGAKKIRQRIDRVTSLGISLSALYRQAGETSLEDALTLAESLVEGLESSP
jgi:hypothetical protein